MLLYEKFVLPVYGWKETNGRSSSGNAYAAQPLVPSHLPPNSFSAHAWAIMQRRGRGLYNVYVAKIIRSFKYEHPWTFLLSISRTPEGNDYPQTNDEISIDNSLNLLTRVFPSFNVSVSGKRVVDFGCGDGYQSIALVKKYGCSVIGVDSNQKTLRKAIENANDHNISSKELFFVENISENMLNSFDVVVS